MKMTAKEKKDFDNLCSYVKTDIMGYGDDMKLSKYMILRLKGMSEGKYIANKNVKMQAKYSYKIILLTFKLCRKQIESYIFKNKSIFNDEKHKFNGIMVIVDGEINNTVKMLTRAAKAKAKTEEVDMSHQNNTQAKYKTKGENKKSEKLDKLW